MKRKRVFFKTFGCRTNQFDTQVMINRLKDFDLSFEESDSDIIIVNSCTVTNGADVSVRHYINAARRRNPNARIVLAGCGALSRGGELLKKNMVYGIIGHSEKEKINDILMEEKNFSKTGNLEHTDKTLIRKFSGKSRAFIKIQEGCSFDCSYCIIPSVRGGARSQDEDLVLRQVSLLASEGFGEFIMTGTNVGSYGRDKGSSLARLLKKLSRINGVRRIRIGSLEPMQIDKEFLELLNEEWMAKHLHIALQHTSDKMLRIMNRRNRFADDCRLFEKLASYGYALGTDFIVGHPGEDEKEWDISIERIDRLPLTHIHAFTYSRRDGTVSARMKESVPGDIARKRHRELVERIKHKNYLFRKKHSENLTVLVEKSGEGDYRGYDQYYNRIAIKSGNDLSGRWLQIDKAEIKEGGNYAFV